MDTSSMPTAEGWEFLKDRARQIRKLIGARSPRSLVYDVLVETYRGMEADARADPDSVGESDSVLTAEAMVGLAAAFLADALIDPTRRGDADPDVLNAVLDDLLRASVRLCGEVIPEKNQENFLDFG